CARKCHLRERIVRRASRLHADEHAATRGGGFVGIQNAALGKYEIDWCKRGAANWQVMEQIFVEEIRYVTDDGLRMNVVRGRVLRRSAVKVENKPFTLLRQ